MPKHQPTGYLTTINACSPGDVIYLRPDHKKYKAEHFAIVTNNTGIVGDSHRPRAVLIDRNARAFVRFRDDDRCVEVASQQLAADCTGLTRREIARACAVLREEQDPGDLSGDDLIAWINRGAELTQPAETPERYTGKLVSRPRDRATDMMEAHASKTLVSRIDVEESDPEIPSRKRNPVPEGCEDCAGCSDCLEVAPRASGAFPDTEQDIAPEVATTNAADDPSIPEFMKGGHA